MKSLQDLIFSSEKRKNVLLLLREGAQEMDDLLVSLDTTRTALLPQLKVLEDHYLVDHRKDAYELTTLGKLLVNKMLPLFDTVGVFDRDIDYWGTRNLNFIPPNLLSGMSALGKSTIIDVSPTDQYDIQSIYQEKSKEAKSVYVVTALLYPNYHKVFSDMIDNNVEMYVIVSEDLFERIRTHYHADFKNYMKSKLIHLYVYNKKMDFLFFTFDDFHVLMHPFKGNEDIDSKLVFFNVNAKALQWLEELFNCYLKDSVPVTEI